MPRKLVSIAVAVTLMALFSSSATAAGGNTPDQFSKNAEFITNIPINTDAAGGRIVGHYFYVNSSQDLEIYDISKPTAPVRVGELPLPETPQFPQEDVDTNGRILVVDGLREADIVNVEDKTNPTIVAKIANGQQHTLTCVLDCTYVYGSEGEIIDIRKPDKPKVVGNWSKGSPAKSFHDVTEVSPGLILTSTQPMTLLDARKDPAHPKILAIGANSDGRFIHANLWPENGHDKFLLVGGESEGNCDSKGSGSFMTWDATHWRTTHTFTMIDQYRQGNGLPTDNGQSPDNTFCAHWFRTNPADWDNGGLVAMSWYEHGTRFFNVSPAGKITEVGYWQPFGTTEASSPYWVTNRILYIVDYNRGIDIIKYTGKL